MLWLCLRFPYLQLNCCDIRFAHPETMAITRQQRIWLANQAAQQAQVCVGQSIGHALMVEPGLQLFDYDEDKASDKFDHLSQWAYRFSSQVHQYDENTLLLEIGRSLSLFKGLTNLYHLISNQLENLNLDVVYGLGHTPKAAHLLSFSEQTPWHEADIEQDLQQALLVNLAVDAKTLAQLSDCGFVHLADVLAISNKELSQRFNKSFIVYLDKLLGRVPDPLLTMTPPEYFSRTLHFAEPIRNRLWIDQQIDFLLQDLVNFLKSKNQLCRDFSWHFYAENNRLLKRISISLASTQCDVDVFRQLTDLQFAKLNMRWEFSSIGLTSESLLPRDQFHNDLFDPKPDQEGINQFIEKLSNRLGKSALHKMSTEPEQVPELASHKQTLDHSPTLAAISKRAKPVPQSVLMDEPLFLLKPPKKLAQHANQPLYQGALSLVHGPHRISSHWWMQLCSRDYYIARQASGRFLWIYYERSRRSWYLHGLFA